MLFTCLFLSIVLLGRRGARNGGMPVRLSGLNLLIRFLLLSKLQVYTAGDTQESMWCTMDVGL